MTPSKQDSHHEAPHDAAIEEAFGMFVRHVQAPLGFRARVMARIAAESPTLRDPLVRWVSYLWHPLLAGEPVTAADTRTQAQIFRLDGGEIRVTCAWRAAYQDQPAVLRVAWQAHTGLPGEFWVRFTQQEDPTAVLAEMRLGSFSKGEKVFTSDLLGFDPTRQPWALALLLKDSSA